MDIKITIEFPIGVGKKTGGTAMRLQRLITAATVPAFALTLACDRKPNLNNDKAKLSYAIGQNIAQNIKAQNILKSWVTLLLKV
jgi:hypothetical protein